MSGFVVCSPEGPRKSGVSGAAVGGCCPTTLHQPLEGERRCSLLADCGIRNKERVLKAIADLSASRDSKVVVMSTCTTWALVACLFARFLFACCFLPFVSLSYHFHITSHASCFFAIYCLLAPCVFLFLLLPPTSLASG